MLQMYIWHYENGTHRLDGFREKNYIDSELQERMVSFEEASTRIGEEIEIIHCTTNEGNTIITATLTDVAKTLEGITFASYIPSH